jgi:PGF-CTERM protein
MGTAGASVPGAQTPASGTVTTAETPTAQPSATNVTGQSDQVRTSQTSNETLEEFPPELREALPDSLLDRLPPELVQTLLGALPENLAGDIEEQLGVLDDIPDSLLNNIINQTLDNIPQEFLENPPDDLVENPPDEIPAVLCRAADMPKKKDPLNKEVWGPTDANSQIGNHNLTVATNELGTVTVFKYPNPSYADQIKHHAFDRRAPYYDSDPNAGALLGVTMTMEDGSTEFDWLRDWGPVSTSDPDYGDDVDQHYASQFTDTLVTEFDNDTLGLDVQVVNAVPKDHDVFIRDVTVDAREGSPVEDVELVSYANFNLVDTKDSAIPTQDWCAEQKNDENASYDSGSDAIVYETPNDKPDLPAELVTGNRAGPQFAIGTAMAFDDQSSQHQVAGDAYIGNHSGDPYALLTNGTLDLPGNDSFDGQTSTALTRDLDFEDGQGQARVYFAAAHDSDPNATLGDEAAAKIETARDLSLPDVREEKAEWFRQYVADAPMPENAPENVTRVARRALISVAQVWDDDTENEHGFAGNIVASIATQAPYGADWIRDGAYFNYALDRYFGENASGQHDWVNQHNRWYKSLQQNPGGECPEHCHDNMQYYDLGLGVIPESSLIRNAAAEQLPFISRVPEGGWAMNYYADGVPAGPLGGEIDETSYGAWTFWDHYAVTGNESYLREIYPAIKLVGDRLVEDCVDPETKLQCPRPEDDNPEYTQSMTGGASAYAGLASATKAAAAMYDSTGDQSYAEDAMRYAQRRDELGAAIDQYYWNETRGSYGSVRALMPAFVRPLDNPRMQAQMQHMWDRVNRTFSGQKDKGQYEAKSLIGLGVASYEADQTPISREQLQNGVEWIANKHARSNSTYHMGEAWLRETYADGEVDSAVSQPHIWEQTLLYLASLLAYGNESISEQDRVGHDVYTEWRQNDAALTGMEMGEEQYVAGETVEATATIRNDAPVAQSYHVTYTVEGPDGTSYNGTATDVGPIPAGESQAVSLTWTADGSTGRYDATAQVWRATPTGDDDTVDPVDIAANPTALSNATHRRVTLDEQTATDAFQTVQATPAEFAVSSIDPANASVTQGDVIDVSADVTNTGDQSGSATVELTIDGSAASSQDVTLNGGETTTVTFTDVDTGGLSSGEHTHAVNADGRSAEGTLTVQAPANVTVSNLDPTDASVTQGDTLDVSADVANAGDQSGSANVTLTIGGDSIDSQNVTVDGGASTTVTFSGVNTSELSPGNYTHTVSADGSSVSGTLVVETAGGGTETDSGDGTGDGTGDGAGDGNESDGNESGDGSGPGFGVLVAALALVGAALLALRRQ